ncbi:DUF2842 domain-containing protein [Sphingomonas sp. GCM10030256]|uniref:DUF2842 domain-containing protein n=1 Tax=Sphingomonas sp. GCM10030256 TaxID=3273427 RepID=UPI0036063613
MLNPRWRTLAGIAMILGVIIVWAVLVTSLADLVGDWPVLVQAVFYIAAGTLWVLPLKPLLRWSETGRWRSDGPQG